MIDLYRQSRSEAEKCNELDFWKESYDENIRCRDAIDTAIHENFDGLYLSDKGCKKVLAEFGYDRTMWVLSSSILSKTYGTGDRGYSQEKKNWAKSIIPNYFPREQFVEFVPKFRADVVEMFIDQVCLKYESLGLVGKKECAASEEPQDYEAKLLILKPDMLKEQFKNPVNQYFYATSGFGCSPDKSGKKVFGQFLSDGEKTHFYREDFIGVADREQLPAWAKEKIQEIEKLTMKIRVFQIDHEKDQNHIRYEGLENTLKFSDNKIDPAIYRQVYGGTVECGSLEEVFSLCNQHRMPPGYYGESMSVSNVVEVCNGNQKGFYFVDSAGFKQIEFDITQTNHADMLNILVLENEKAPYEAEIRSCYKAHSSVVKGLIEAVYFEPMHDAVVYCNEEFLLHDYKPNRLVGNTLIHGTFFVVGNTQNEYGEWDSCSLTNEQISKYSEMFAEPIQMEEELQQDEEITMVLT